MRKRLVNLGLTIVLGGLALLMPPATFAAAPWQPQNIRGAGSRPPLTNAEVIRMLQTIMSSIRSGPVKFDLSPTGLAALRQAGVSEPILNAMVQAERQAQASGKPGSPTPAGAAGIKPGQPTRKLTPQQIRTLLAKVHSGKGKLSPVVTNPAATQANAAMIAILRQQKQRALIERSLARPPAGRPQSPLYSRAVAARTSIRMAAPPPSSGNSLANRTAMHENIAMACGTFTSPIIQTVSGQSGSMAVFTQDPSMNPFTIKGCNFGNSKGQAQLNFSNGRKLADLTIDTWTDNLITVEVPPSLTDVLDQPTVTLVLFPASGPQASRPGFKFYAMRREILLTSIPTGQVSLATIKDDSGAPVTPLYSSPYKDQYTGQYLGMSAGVDRDNGVRFPGGTDVFYISSGGLKPGFVLEKYQVKELSAASAFATCFPAVVDATNYTDGTWGWQTVGDSIRVSWQEAHSHTPCDDTSDASYGLNVWVVGPAMSSGASPWQ